MTMALCGGAPARLQALTAAFRDMQPYLLHVWRLKTFWHQGLLRRDDVDMQRWEQAEGAPPTRSTPDALRSFFAPGGLTRYEQKVADEDAQRLIRVLVDGLGVGRERYETWFRRAGRAKTREVMKAFDKWDPGDGAEDGVPGVGDGAGCDERERRSDERRTR